MKGDVMLKANLADIFNHGELKLAEDLYTSIEKHGRAKFESFMEGEIKPNARLLTPRLIYLLMVSAQEILQKDLRAEKKERFVPVREKGTKKKIEDARQLQDNIKTMNADLLAKPASEGWGSKKKRADHISKRTGKSFSYINRLIAIPRNTNQS